VEHPDSIKYSIGKWKSTGVKKTLTNVSKISKVSAKNEMLFLNLFNLLNHLFLFISWKLLAFLMS